MVDWLNAEVRMSLAPGMLPVRDVEFSPTWTCKAPLFGTGGVAVGFGRSGTSVKTTPRKLFSSGLSFESLMMNCDSVNVMNPPT